jgi:hypothetical protein
LALGVERKLVGSVVALLVEVPQQVSVQQNQLVLVLEAEGSVQNHRALELASALVEALVRNRQVLVLVPEVGVEGSVQNRRALELASVLVEALVRNRQVLVLVPEVGVEGSVQNHQALELALVLVEALVQKQVDSVLGLALVPSLLARAAVLEVVVASAPRLVVALAPRRVARGDLELVEDLVIRISNISSNKVTTRYISIVKSPAKVTMHRVGWVSTRAVGRRAKDPRD